MDVNYTVLPGGKDFDLTHKLQDLTNKLCNVRDLHGALKVCNKTLAMAPYNSTELFTAIASKTSILYAMNRYEACLQNINLALQHPKCPKWISSDLEGKKKKCVAILNESCNSVQVDDVDASKQPDPADRIKRKESGSENLSLLKSKISTTHLSYRESNVSRIKNGSDETQCFIDGITVVVNKEHGRHIIATEDLNPGIVLVMEKSIFSSLYLEEVFDHCSNCLARSDLLIPCRKCSKALFCSEHCLCNANNRYHTIECALMDYFANLDASDSHLPLIIRMLSILSKQGAYLEKLKQKWDKLKTMELYYPKEINQLIIPDNLITLVFYLQASRYTEEELLRSTFKYRKLVEHMKQKTKFFSHAHNSSNNHDIEKFVISLLVELEARCKCNVYAVTEKIFDRNKTYDNLLEMNEYIVQKTIGISYCKFLNFFNHSCIPNATYTFQEGDNAVVCALRSIKSGEQVSLCYTGMYYEICKADRQEKLSKYFGFACKCVACTGDWSTILELKTLSRIMKHRYSYDCCCHIQKQILQIIDEISVIGCQEKYADICEQLGDKIVDCLQLFEQLGVNNVFSSKEYAQVFRLFRVYLDELGNCYRERA